MGSYYPFLLMTLGTKFLAFLDSHTFTVLAVQRHAVFICNFDLLTPLSFGIKGQSVRPKQRWKWPGPHTGSERWRARRGRWRWHLAGGDSLLRTFLHCNNRARRPSRPVRVFSIFKKVNFCEVTKLLKLFLELSRLILPFLLRQYP